MTFQFLATFVKEKMFASVCTHGDETIFRLVRKTRFNKHSGCQMEARSTLLQVFFYNSNEERGMVFVSKDLRSSCVISSHDFLSALL